MSSPMSIEDGTTKFVPTIVDECIICYDQSYDENQLLKGSDIFDSACKCNYMVHRACINTWLETKNQHSCICCNSVATLEPIRNSISDNITEVCCNLLLLTLITIMTILFLVIFTMPVTSTRRSTVK